MTTTASELKTYLEQIRKADATQVEAQLDIARILTAIKEYELYTPKYTNFKMMVQCELDFAVTCAEHYVSLHRHYKSLNYGRDEFLKLMRQFGWRKVNFAIRGQKKKMGYRAMKRYIQEHFIAQDRQYNFNLSSDAIAEKLESTLKSHGLVTGNNGRRHNLTTALEGLLVDYERLKLAENKRLQTKASKAAKATKATKTAA